MQYVVLACIVLAVPLFFGLPEQGGRRRNVALGAIGLLVFVGGSIQSDVALISWPLWNGTARGIVVGPLDVFVLLLILTRPLPSRGMPLIWPILLYMTAIIGSLLVANVPMATFFSICQFARSGLIFFAVAGELSRRGATLALLKGLALGLALQAGYVIYQKLSGVVQASGTFAHQNMLGMMVVMAMMPMVSVLLEGERSRLVQAGVISGMIVVVGGGSRGAMAVAVAALVILVIISIMRRSTPRKMQVVRLGLLAVLLVAPMGYMTLRERFGDTSMAYTEDQREALERAAHLIIADHPMGIGANQFTVFSNIRGYSNRAGVNWNQVTRSVPVHNIYLLARAETGPAGQITLLFLILFPIIAGIRLAFANRSSYGGAAALGAAIGILGVAAQSNYEFALALFPAQSIMLLDIGIIAGHLLVQQRARPRGGKSRRPVIAREQAQAVPVPVASIGKAS